MKEEKLICYYSDLYRALKKELSIRILVVNNKGHLVAKRNIIKEKIFPASVAKYTVYKELFSLLEGVEEDTKIKKIDIISFDKKCIPSFIEIGFNGEETSIYNISTLRKILSKHKKWTIRYDGKSRDVFKKLYTQTLNKKGTKLKGFKLPRKIRRVRRSDDSMYSNCNKIIFFDVEMNCIDKIDNTLGYWEIVSIGAVKYNKVDGSISKFYRVIKPKVQSIVSDRCTKITGLTQEDIDNGISYKIAMREMDKWVGDGKALFLSWGREDIKAIKANTTLKGNHNDLAFRIRKSFIDFQKEFSSYYLKSNQVVSLSKALIELGLEFDGQKHNALSDAYNLYRIYKSYTNKLPD
ncbi:MAG: 3'-5' exonuclease [Clostridium sp.]|uniref:3'-5' exonuclease n=1 Tax=Clostridium sp. TaxID=1506 RepID=UPI002FCA591A